MLTRRQLLASATLPWSLAAAASSRPTRRLTGMVWQPSARTVRPRGDWATLGIQRLLVQWTAVDNRSFLPGVGLALQPELPDWSRIAAEPWAGEVILGLAGLHDERSARGALAQLVVQSRALRFAADVWPLRVRGWYFPVEADPGWTPPTDWFELLAVLPRPLWLSVYDSANLGADAVARWIERWVPPGVGVFFQDGVGVHARTAAVARQYLQVLTRRLGAARVEVIAEAFRPALEGGFRSATAEEFLPQLDAYQDWPILAFDGPHYLSQALVRDLRAGGVVPDAS
ncbi:MAG TPA: hypothetical protein PKA16_12275 [Ottowia sp.]|uniref:hypothetical protein n=1 Tax=Ottowia sp. TaxID=1898956 RepID=UPI002C8B47B4|nr:hypothetical protein [Ottowia sp.]HMN22154.1 hypothetical protein [Ottowia sp.]